MKTFSILLVAFVGASVALDVQELKRRIPNGMWKPVEGPVDTSKYALGAFEETGAKRLRTKKANLEGYTAPESFDSREQWPGCTTIGMVWDQAGCGSCWAVSSAAVMSDRKCIHSDQASSFQVSPEQLMDCCWYCGDGCMGGWPSQTFEYWQNEGIVSGGFFGTTDTCQPYSIDPSAGSYDDTPPCSKTCTNEEYELEFEEDKSFGVDGYHVDNDEMAWKQEIETNGPIVAIFDVYDDFFYYSSGVYSHTFGSYAGGHAVRVVGWGNENGEDYWLVANSWAEEWGEQGLFKVSIQNNNCNFNTGASTGMPKV